MHTLAYVIYRSISAVVREQLIQLVDAELPTSDELVSGMYHRKIAPMRDHVPGRPGVSTDEEITNLICSLKTYESYVETLDTQFMALRSPDVVDNALREMDQCELRLKRARSFARKMDRERELNDARPPKRPCSKRAN